MNNHSVPSVYDVVNTLLLFALAFAMMFRFENETVRRLSLEERMKTLEHSLECVQGEAGEVRRWVDRDHWAIQKLIHRQKIEGTEPQLAEPMKEGR